MMVEITRFNSTGKTYWSYVVDHNGHQYGTTTIDGLDALLSSLRLHLEAGA